MVVGQCQHVTLGCSANQQQAHQRRSGEVESGDTVVVEETLEFLSGPRPVPGQIHLTPRHVHPVDNQLRRDSVLVVLECGTQIGVVCEHAGGSTAQPRRVDRALEVDAQLRGVDVQ
ncbi:hypothetical protein MLGJGCBP_03100 [Rhodococcus sp. T7]|nr:hypothetical protein MLGJGCBP_03100 [Rhodococcus sp. T7]